MLKNIALERPLAVIDLETTGIDPKCDRIIEVSVLKLAPGGEADHRTRRVNPGVPIPPEATAVHGITDDDVADMPHLPGDRPWAGPLPRRLRPGRLQRPELRPAAARRRVQPGRDDLPGGRAEGHRRLPASSTSGSPET